MDRQNPADIIQMVDRMRENTANMRDNFQAMYALYILEYFSVKQADTTVMESKRLDRAPDVYVSNRPQVYADKIVGLLANAQAKFEIPIDTQNKDKRKRMSEAERAAYGIINAADERLARMGDVKLQAAMSYYLAVFGLAPALMIVFKDRENDNKTTFGGQVFSPYDFMWDYGSKGLSWACPVTYRSQTSLEYDYNKSFSGDDINLIPVYNFWDKEQNRIIIQGEQVDGFRHGLGYVPFQLAQSSQMPHFHLKDQNCSEHWYTGILESIKTIAPEFCRAMSDYQHLTSLAADSPLYIFAKGGAGKLALQDNPKMIGGVSVFDADVVTDVKESVPAQMTASSNYYLQMILQEINNATLSNIAYGNFDSSIPVGTTNMLMSATQSQMKRTQSGVEEAMAWIVNEAMSQYRSGDFESVEVTGLQYSNKGQQMLRFSLDRSKIDENWRFKCRLIPDLPQDETQNLNSAVVATKNELVSKKYAQDKWLNIEDTDQMADQIALEKADTNPIVQLTKQLEALTRDDLEGNKAAIMSMLMMLNKSMADMQAQLMGGGQMGGPGQPGAQGGQQPMMPGNGAQLDRGAGSQMPGPAVPPEVSQAVSGQGQQGVM